MRRRAERTQHFLKSHIIAACFGESLLVIGPKQISSHSTEGLHAMAGREEARLSTLS